MTRPAASPSLPAHSRCTDTPLYIPRNETRGSSTLALRKISPPRPRARSRAGGGGRARRDSPTAPDAAAGSGGTASGAGSPPSPPSAELPGLQVPGRHYPDCKCRVSGWTASAASLGGLQVPRI